MITKYNVITHHLIMIMKNSKMDTFIHKCRNVLTYLKAIVLLKRMVKYTYYNCNNRILQYTVHTIIVKTIVIYILNL